MGDGVLVYFGYPRAHEDDAERAIRAGMRAISAVSLRSIWRIKKIPSRCWQPRP